MDHRRLLQREGPQVLPYFGGARIDAASRHFRVDPPPGPPGWYRFRIAGRKAIAEGGAPAPELEGLPGVRGVFLSGRLIREGARSEPLWLMPEEEPPRFSPVKARRWHSGELLFEALEFEGEAEEQVRRALEEDGALGAVRGASAPLRAAFAYAVLEAASRRLAIPASSAELRGQVAAVADGGRAQAERTLRALAQERELARRELLELARRRQQLQVAEEVRVERERRVVQAGARAAQARDEAPTRAEQALEAAGARLASARVLAGGNLEVVFTFMHERFIAVVNAATLQVLDSGICLGHPPRDELLTLESLPSVIKEAIGTDSLVILRHA